MPVLNLSFDLGSEAGLADFNTFMESRSYIVGFAPSKADLVAVQAIGSAPDAATYPNVFRYFNHINSFKMGQTKKWAQGVTGITSGGAAPPAPPAPAAAGAGAGAGAGADSDSDSDDGDLFGSDSDDDGAVDAAAAAAPAEKKKQKPKKVEKTQLTLYANPKDSETSIEELEAAIRGITIEGLRWGDAFGVEDIAFGLQRIHAQCVIVNDLVGLDMVVDAVEALELCGSTAPGTMNRLG